MLHIPSHPSIYPRVHHLCYIIRLDNNLTPTHGNYEASRKFEGVMEQE